MIVIVPLAGPDFEYPDGSSKAEDDIGGQPMIQAVLESRSWWAGFERDEGSLVFILRDSPVSRRVAVGLLLKLYPRAKIVWLGAGTQGAAMTILAGLSLVAHQRKPVCVDLADILFWGGADPVEAFKSDEQVGGILQLFSSDQERYSYATREASGYVIETKEKEVISNSASCGTYWFRNPSILLGAISWSLHHSSELTFRGLHYVCPLMNGVIATGHRVMGLDVDDCRDVRDA